MKEDYIPGIILGKRYPDIAVQISKRAIAAFIETNQDERLANGKKFNLVIEGRRHLVTPSYLLHDPVSLDPKFINWNRLCEPLPKETVRRAPRKQRAGGPPKRYPWIDHPHLAISVPKKPWMTPERREDRKNRRNMHIHDYLGIPR